MRSGIFTLIVLFSLLLAGCGNTPLALQALQSKTPSNHTTTNTAAVTAVVSNATNSSESSKNTSNEINHNLLQKLPQTRHATDPFPLLKVGSSGLSVLRLQQMLASLGYLPVTWQSNHSTKKTVSYEMIVLSSPPKGSFTWSNQDLRRHLQNLWNTQKYTVVTEGAVMAFEKDHGLAIDGVAGPHVWTALIHADISRQRNSHGYTYVYVSKSLPEHLTLWLNGKKVLVAAANTGISSAPTPNGTWPIYMRYRSQTMSGTDPSGQHYSDPGVPYVNYFYHGDAIHGFTRSTYGSPQSLGCVELSYANAKNAWNYLDYGTLVTVGP